MNRKVHMPKPVPFTHDGYQKLLRERDTLLQERKSAVSELQRARELGDLKENGFYRGAKFKLTAIDRRLRELTHLIRYGTIVEQQAAADTIALGVQVTVTDGKEKKILTLVGEFEVNPSENKISHKSPIGKQLLGKKTGDTISITVPSGIVTYSILAISLP